MADLPIQATLIRGSTRSITFAMQDENNSPDDLSAVTSVTASIKDQAGDTSSYWSGAGAISGSNIIVTPNVNTIPVGVYVMDVRAVRNDAVVLSSDPIYVRIANPVTGA